MNRARVKLETLLLGGTALVGVAAVPLFGGSLTALAACIVTPPAEFGAATTVTCGTTDTLPTTFPTNLATGRDARYAFDVPINGTISGGATISGAGLWFEALGPQMITVTNNGSVTTNFNDRNGLTIQGNGGTINYFGNGSASSSASSGFFAGLAIFNNGNGDVNVGTSSVPITGTFSGRHGLYIGVPDGSDDQFNGNQTVFLSGGSATATAATGVGIFLDGRSGSGALSITTTGGTVINAQAEGFGIAVHSGGGSASLTTDAQVGSLANRVGTGLFATVDSGDGAVSVNQTGGFIFAGSFGIAAQNNGSGSVTVTAAGDVNSSGTGILTIAAGNGATTVTNSGSVSGAATFGIRTDAVDGATTITNSGNVSGGLAGISAVSIGAGPITINNTGTVTGGNGGISIFSDHAPVQINTTGTIAGINFNGIGVDSLTGSITIHATSGTVSGGAISPNSGISVATGGAGNIIIDGAATITGFSGIFAGFEAGATGSATVNTTGNITGTGGIAIEAGGLTTGAISVQTSGVVSGVEGGINVRNVGNGLLSVGVNGGSVTTTGGNAISAQTTGGANINIANSGTLTSSGMDSSAVIAATSTTGAITIINNVGGVIQSLANSPSDLAIATSGGPATISNAGTLTGRLSLGGSGNLVSNTGTWSTGGTSDFGSGSFSNSGIVNLANGSALNNLSNFQNFGTVRTPNAGTSAVIGVASSGAFINAGNIDLQNNFAGDRLTLDGNFVGISGSQLLFDFAPQSNTADLFVITGNASGSTAVAVNNLNPSVPFTLSAPLVQVNGTVAPNTFTLGTLQNFGALDVVLLSGVGSIPNSFALSLATVPSAAGLSGAAALQGAQTVAFQSNSAVLDQVSEVRDLQRRGAPIGVPLSYAEQDPWRAYGASLPNAMKAPTRVAPVAAPAPPAARLATWGRVYGDFEKRDNNIASFTLAGQLFTRDLNYDARGGGLLAGADVVLSNLTSAADGLIFGPFGGYTTARVNFNNAGVTQNFSGGTVGAKATYVNGGFFADAIVKADLLSLDINAVALNQSSDLTNLSVLGNVGYKFDLSRGFYVEPTAGFEYVQTNFSESPLLTATTVPLLDGHVTRLRAGARFGTELVTNNIRIEPSVLPLVYYIADASGLETFTAGGPGVITFPSDEGKLFGEIQASVNFLDLTSGWSGFVRADLRFGEDLFGGSGKAGIRYTW